jgi:hypothetical protein
MRAVEPYIVRFAGDNSIDFQVTMNVDCTGETLIAKLYVLGYGSALVKTVPIETPVTGGAIGAVISITLDFSGVVPYSNYSLVFTTAESGTVAKSPFVMLAEDGYTEGQEEAPGVWRLITQEGLGDKVLTDDGTYKEIDDFIPEIARISGTPTNNYYAVWDSVNNGIRFVNLNDSGIYKDDDSIEFIDLGNPLSIATVGDSSITKMDANNVAIASPTLGLRFYNYLSETWSKIGSTFTLGGATYPQIASLSATRVAYIDGGNEELRAYTFSGSAWSLTGSGLSIPGISLTSLVALSATRVALFDITSDQLRAYDFDGANWSSVGNPLTISGATNSSMAALNSTTVALYINGNNELEAYSFNGTDWSSASNALALTEALSFMTTLSETRVAIVGSTSDTLSVYDLDGLDWSQKGDTLDVVNGAIHIAAMNPTDVAVIDPINDNLRAYSINLIGRLAFWTGEGLQGATSDILIKNTSIDVNKNLIINAPQTIQGTEATKLILKRGTGLVSVRMTNDTSEFGFDIGDTGTNDILFDYNGTQIIQNSTATKLILKRGTGEVSVRMTNDTSEFGFDIGNTGTNDILFDYNGTQTIQNSTARKLILKRGTGVVSVRMTDDTSEFGFDIGDTGTNDILFDSNGTQYIQGPGASKLVFKRGTGLVSVRMVTDTNQIGFDIGDTGTNDILFDSSGVQTIQNSGVKKLILKRGTGVMSIKMTTDTNHLLFDIGDTGTSDIEFDSNGDILVSSLTGSGTQDAQLNANGKFVRITSDESTKDIIGPLTHGLDYVLAVKKCTIVYDYKDKGLNAEGYHNWGFGAGAVEKEFGSNPAFRKHEGVFNWDSKQMIAPLYNAVAELNEKIENIKA